ncbi:hypothetical protein JCM5353_001201 [Sporobolomyces roseus]
MTAAPSASLPSTLPPRLQIESSLSQLLQSLLELGICASDVQESALEASVGGVAQGLPGGLIGIKANQVVQRMARLHEQKESVGDVMIPLEVVATVDQGRNPHTFTKDFIERLSGENMYTNGILSAVTDYRDLLNEQMKDAFPDLADMLQKPDEAKPGDQSQNPDQMPSNGLSSRETNGVGPGLHVQGSVGGGENGFGGGVNGNSSGSNGEVKMEE